MTKRIYERSIDAVEKEIKRNYKKETEQRELKAKIAELERQNECLLTQLNNLRLYIQELTHEK